MAAPQKPNLPTTETAGPLRVRGYEPGALDVTQGKAAQVVITFVLSRPLDTFEQYWADAYAEERNGYIRVEHQARATTIAPYPSGIETWVTRINEQLIEIESEGARSR